MGSRRLLGPQRDRPVRSQAARRSSSDLSSKTDRARSSLHDRARNRRWTIRPTSNPTSRHAFDAESPISVARLAELGSTCGRALPTGIRLVASDEQAVDEDLEHRADGFGGQVALIDHARDSADEAGKLEGVDAGSQVVAELLDDLGVRGAERVALG